MYSLRLISPRGVSNAVRFPVVDEPVVVETTGSHQTIEQAQPVTFPVVMNGKLGKRGELDYYSLHAKAGQELSFKVVRGEEIFDPGVQSERFTPQLALYHPGGSWFDPHRPTRLLSEEEKSSDLMPIEARGTYRFPQDGQYFLEISGLFGQGCPDCAYQVRVASREKASSLEASDIQLEAEWAERSFSRELQDSWIATLRARRVNAGERSAQQARAVAFAQASGSAPSADRETTQVVVPTSPSFVMEREVNARASQALEVSIPCVVEGTLDHPGDVDNFKFTVKPGQKLAFETETPESKPPHFNPRLGILDSQDREVFSNVERRLTLYVPDANPGVYIQGVQPKAIYTFERGG